MTGYQRVLKPQRQTAAQGKPVSEVVKASYQVLQASARTRRPVVLNVPCDDNPAARAFRTGDSDIELGRD